MALGLDSPSLMDKFPLFIKNKARSFHSQHGFTIKLLFLYNLKVLVPNFIGVTKKK